MTIETYSVLCDACDGRGYNGREICIKCDGNGQVLVPDERHTVREVIADYIAKARAYQPPWAKP